MIGRTALGTFARTAAAPLAPGLVILAACAVYLNSLANGFALDDIYIIHQNTRVHDLGAWRDIWLTPYWPSGNELGLYRPLIVFLFSVQWAMGGGEPWVFHAGNVLLHATASLLGFLLLEKLTGRTPALVGALVFAVHPVHTEAVANVVGQAEIVAAVATLAACLIHLSRPPGAPVSWPRRAALCALFAVALLTKESAVVLPGLLVAVDCARGRLRPTLRGFADYADAMLMPLLLLTATFAFYLVLRFDVMSGALLGLDANPALPFLREEHRIVNALRAFPEFMRLLLFPSDLISDYAPGVILPVDSLSMMSLLGAVLLFTAVGLALVTPWWPAVGLPAAWFLLSILTVSNLFFPIGVVVAERTLYTPSVALSVSFAYVTVTLVRHASPSARRLACAALIVVLLLFSARSWIRNPVWDSTETVLSQLVREHPESYKAQWFRADMVRRSGKLDEAHFRYALAYRIYRRDLQLMRAYSGFLLGVGNSAAAVSLLEQVYARQPNVAGSALDLGFAYLTAGRNRDAIARIRDAEKLGAPTPKSMVLKALAHERLGDPGTAIGVWRVVIQSTTLAHSWISWAFLARNLAIGGYNEEAAAALDRGVALAADSSAHHTLERFRSALDKGCYTTMSPADGSVLGAVRFACDALGTREVHALYGQAENASPLQNASMVQPRQTGNDGANRDSS